MAGRLSVLAAVFVSSASRSLAASTLYAIGGVDLSGDGITESIAAIDILSGRTKWSPTFNVPNGVEFCTNGFGVAGNDGVYHIISTTNVQTFNASTGIQIANVAMSLGYDLDVAGLDAESGLLWGIGTLGEGNFDVITISPTTGKVDKLVTNMPFDSLGPCEASASAAVSDRAFFFDTQGDSYPSDEIVRFSIADKTFSKPVVYAPNATGTIWSVSSWVPVKSADGSGLVAASAVQLEEAERGSAPVADQALVIGSRNDTEAYELVSIDVAAATTTHLMYLNTSYSAQQASFVFEASTGMAYAVIQGPHSLVTYSVVAFNLTVSPPSAHYAHIPDSKNAQYGIMSPAIAR